MCIVKYKQNSITKRRGIGLRLCAGIIPVISENYISRYVITSKHQKYSKKFERKRIAVSRLYIFDASMKIYVIKRQYYILTCRIKL